MHSLKDLSPRRSSQDFLREEELTRSSFSENKLDENGVVRIKSVRANRSEFLFVHALQIFLFVVCFMFSRTVTNPHDWREQPILALVLGSIFGNIFLILILTLPSQIPTFLAI